MRAFKYSVLLLFAFILFASFARADEAAADVEHADEQISEADRAAQEEAMRGVTEQAEIEEDEDGGDAMDEDADAARPHPDRHPLTDLPESARDVIVGHTFVSGGLKDDGTVLTLGEKVDVLVALANGGRSKYHVWGIMGSLNMAGRFNMYVQNFSYTEVNASVPSGEELSMAYSFTPNERLDTRDFQLAMSVFYEAQNSEGNALRGHSTTFYNSTVGTVPGPQAVSNTAFLILTALFLIVSGAGIAFLLKPPAEGEKKPTSSRSGGEASNSENDWLEEHMTTMQTGGGRSKLTKRR